VAKGTTMSGKRIDPSIVSWHDALLLGSAVCSILVAEAQ
jgi:hypothetical protein